MKRIVDIFTKDWTNEIVWTYVLNLGDDYSPIDLNAFESEALRLAIDENRGVAENIFAKVRE
jgi:hypothetical protein